MKKLVLVLISYLAGILLFTSCNKQTTEPLAVCGDRTVMIIDLNTSKNQDINVLWQWEREEMNGKIPEEYVKRFNNIDECKFVDNNTKLLITCGSGGVALIDIDTRDILFYAYSPLSHSADLLPNNRIAVALSIHDQGNSLQLYDIDKPDVVIFKDSLYSGHGSLWMDKLNKFYALGYDELREYSLKDWDTNKPSLQLERQWTLPTSNGHDLSSITDNELLITTANSSYVFNINQEEFSDFGPLTNVPHVKSVVYNKEKDAIVYTKAEEEWWTYNIYSTNPDQTINIPTLKIYKARTYPQTKGATLTPISHN